MVKGLAKRVVVVKSPDKRIFEEAIFILKEDALRNGVSAQDVIREACRVAAGYTHGKRSRALRILIAAAAALAMAALGWILGRWT